MNFRADKQNIIRHVRGSLIHKQTHTNDRSRSSKPYAIHYWTNDGDATNKATQRGGDSLTCLVIVGRDIVVLVVVAIRVEQLARLQRRGRRAEVVRRRVHEVAGLAVGAARATAPTQLLVLHVARVVSHLLCDLHVTRIHVGQKLANVSRHAWIRDAQQRINAPRRRSE